MCMSVCTRAKLIYEKLCHFNNYKKSNRDLHFSYFRKFLPLAKRKEMIRNTFRDRFNASLSYDIPYYTIKTDLSPFSDVFS